MLKKISLRETTHRFLFEQEEEEATEDIFGGDEEGDDEGGDEPAEEGGEGEEDAAAAEETPDVSSAEQYKLSDSIDAELEALLVDFESEARKSAVVNEPTELGEVLYRRLFESTAADIDLRDFAANVARLVKNYQNLK